MLELYEMVLFANLNSETKSFVIRRTVNQMIWQKNNVRRRLKKHISDLDLMKIDRMVSTNGFDRFGNVSQTEPKDAKIIIYIAWHIVTFD